MKTVVIHTAGTSRLVDIVAIKAIEPALSDADAGVLADQASAMIARVSGRVLHRQEVTETYRNFCNKRIALSRWPISEIVSVTVNGVLLDAGEYETDGMFLYRLSSDMLTGWRASKIAVRYRGGYDPIPLDLSLAVRDLALSINEQAGRDHSLRSINVSDIESRSFRDLANGGGIVPAHVMDTVLSYREIRL